ncbi:NAD-glutamate dehydrogenase domain-containing protein [Chrysiogenes arsenatis]|uniref:NAD-glutamate dehydrogenase domain-containing protein n=1 Tax=Chrysiogenes arsenatis TaxID=309797 RepID=UPI0003FAC0A5|nr:NAD-glutamate dehydrogenase domain-containing protein [Chrysiogenes arsenatis]
MAKVVLRKDLNRESRDNLQYKLDATLELLRKQKKGPSEHQMSLANNLLSILFQSAPRKYLDFISEEQLHIQVKNFLEFLQKRAPGQTNIHAFTPDQDALDFGIFNSSVILINTADKPFLLKSIYSYLNKKGITPYITIHPILNVGRSAAGVLQTIDINYNDPSVSKSLESFIVLQTEIIENDVQLQSLVTDLQQMIGSLDYVVRDFQPMMQKMKEVELYLNTSAAIDEIERKNAAEFFEWLRMDNFIFLGYRQYRIVLESDPKKQTIQVVDGTGLGILQDITQSKFSQPTPLSCLPLHLQERIASDHCITLDKSNAISPVYDQRNMVYLGIRQQVNETRFVEHVFLGIHATKYYSEPVGAFAYLRRKINRVLEKRKILYKSYSYNKVFEIFNHYPKEDLFFIKDALLEKVVVDLLNVISFEKVKIIDIENLNARGQSLLLILPALNYSINSLRTALRVIRDTFQATLFEYRDFGDSTEAIKVYIYLVPGDAVSEVDISALERHIDAQTMDWHGALADQVSLVQSGQGSKADALLKKFQSGFSEAYKASNSPREAAEDMVFFEKLYQTGKDQVEISEHGNGKVQLRFYSLENHLLVDLIPIFQHMGIKVIEENTFHILPAGQPAIMLMSFSLGVSDSSFHLLLQNRRTIGETFLAVVHAEVESDPLNALSVLENMSYNAINVLRMYVEYIFQVGIKYTKRTVWETLVTYSSISAACWNYFDAKFNTKRKLSHEKRLLELEKSSAAIASQIDEVVSLTADYIIRRLHNVCEATLRTSYYKGDAQQRVLSVKIESAKVMDMPLPRPLYEIFVFSRSMNGIHLRGGKVARGGLRWSDRPDDFRTEVLGLVSTQMTKNAVIVPVGSKGGFVLKGKYQNAEEQRAAADLYYRSYIGALLEITDNIIDGEAVHPDNVVCYDELDPYLVVAADKGTAHLSDTANAVSEQYNFWLGDAFASGGSYGYDHKKMGITAKGAWESVKRHFRNTGINIQEEPFTVVGIGDMSGDVFGNGMLLSKTIKLVGAFNHKHIFIDPDPDTITSWEERKRLFVTPRTQWSDYNLELISKGGGIYNRSDKKIALSTEAAKVFGVSRGNYTPDELIRIMLKAPVDLLWNGGIGTYVKATFQTNEEVGDKANDNVRVNGADIQAKVIGEGGNLGCTQEGRIEYALRGGRILSDAIDNSAGVNASDHEVNIKILLKIVTNNGKLTFDERNTLLSSMTDEVGKLVLETNYLNGLSIMIDTITSYENPRLLADLVGYLEGKGLLDRVTENIPLEEELVAYPTRGISIPAPILCKISAYARMDLFNELVAANLEWNDSLTTLYHSYFPKKLLELYPDEMMQHKLKNEILCTLIANRIVDYAGSMFVYNLTSTTNASVAEVAKTYVYFEHLFGTSSIVQSIFALDNQQPSELQHRMVIDFESSLRRAVRWVVTKGVIDPKCNTANAELFTMFDSLFKNADQHLPADYCEKIKNATQQNPYAEYLPEVAQFIEKSRFTADMLSICYITTQSGKSLDESIVNYIEMKKLLDADTFRAMIYAMPVADIWDRKARNTLIAANFDYLERLAMEQMNRDTPLELNLESYNAILSYVKEKGMKNFNPLFIALRGIS